MSSAFLSLSPALHVLLCAFVLYLLSTRLFPRNSHLKRLPLPPGPFRWPIVGNVFDIPRATAEWITFAAWRKIYGNVIYITIFGRPIIVLGSIKAALDLLEKRSSIYSDRPRMVMAGELIGYDHSLVLNPYNARFHKTRRLVKGVLGPGAAGMFEGLEASECARFLARVLDTPECFLEHIRHAAGAIILSISYGYDVSDSVNETDPLVKLAECTMNEFSIAVTPGVFLVDFLPWLKHIPASLPGMGFRRKAALWRQHLLDMAELPYRFTKSRMTLGTARTSFVSRLLEEESTPETEEVIKWAALSLYAGGSDATVSSISTFFLAMCTHPWVQSTAQVELDSVIGSERLPSVSDYAQLPYINAIVQEVLRWAPIGPLGFPHRVIQEDVYEGYRIPAGSIVFANIWGLLHDPEVFPKPDEFRPERFLGEEKMEGVTPANLSQLAFGFGRRHFAESFLFICIAMTLATFNITKAHDEHGNVIEPELEWMNEAISHPKPFKCHIVPRSVQAVSLVRQVIAEQKGEL